MKLEFEITEAMQAELVRLQKATSLTNVELFQKALTLLRIHVGAALKGDRITLHEGNCEHSGEIEYIIRLPFMEKGQ